MRTIILPGYSPHNRDWAEAIAAEISSAEVHAWAHWDSGAQMDPRAELAAIQERIGPDVVNLLAKSVGCRLAARIVLQAPGQLDRVIFCGIPSVAADSRADLAGALARLPADHILVVQNREDPYAPFSEVQGMIAGIDPEVRVVAGEREDHHYPYAEIFREFLTGDQLGPADHK